MPLARHGTRRVSRLGLAARYTPPPAALPSWIPAYGEAITHTNGGGVMTNNWRDAFDPTGVGYSAPSTIDITDYSAMTVAPEYRTYGAHLVWGGGHSATNYNGIVARVYGLTSIYHECVIRPSDWTADLNSGDISGEVNTLGERTDDLPTRRLAFGHNYGSGDVIAGKLVVLFRQAVGYTNFGSFVAAHELDLDPNVSYSDKSWARLRETLGTLSPSGAPTLTRYVSAQNRTYFMPRGGGAPYGVQWYDRSNNTYNTGTGVGFNYADSDAPGFDPRTGALIYVPSRNLLLGIYRLSGVLNIQYMSVGVGDTQPTLGGTKVTTLAVPDAWGAAGWCPRNNRLHIFGVTGNTDKVYEIEIPATLSDAWPTTAHTLPSGTVVPYETSQNSAWGKTFDWIPGIDCFAHHPSGLSGASNDSAQFYRPRSL